MHVTHDASAKPWTFQSGKWFVCIESRFMAWQLAKSRFALLAFGLWILACPFSLAEEDDPGALNRQVTQLLNQGKYQEAILVAERAVEVAKRVRGQEHPETADALNNLGIIFKNTKDYAKAERLYQEALQIRQKVLGPKHPDTVNSLNISGLLYRTMRDYAKAEPLLQEAVARIRKGMFPPALVFQSLNNLAQLYQAMDENAKAEPLLQEVLRIRQKSLGPEDPLTLVSLNNLGAWYRSIGDYDKAEPLLQESVRIRQNVLRSEDSGTVAALDNLGVLYSKMGDYAKAEPLFQEALRMSQKVLGPEHYITAESLNNLRHLYWQTAQYAKAEQPLQEALRICRKTLGSEHGTTAQVPNNLADLYQAMGKYSDAQPLYEEALQIRRKLGQGDSMVAQSLNNLGLLYEKMGDYEKADPLFQEALQIDKKALGPDHPDTAVELGNLASLEFDLGRMDQATALAREQAVAQLKALSKIFSFTSEQQRLAYLNIFRLYSLFPFLKGTETDLATAILRYKGLVLDSIIEDRRVAEASQGSDEQKEVEQLNLDRRELDQLLLEPAQDLSAQTKQRIDALEEEVEKIEGQLARHVAGLGHARRALTVSLEQVQATVPDNGVLIEYVRYLNYLGKQSELRYGAMVLFSKGAPLWIPLQKASEIEYLVRRYRTLVKDSSQDELSENLQALYEALWAPIGQALPAQTNRIVISPDGQLNFISFATLLNNEKQFLAERYDIQYVASGRDLIREPGRSLAKKVVLFANPNFSLAPSQMLAKPDDNFSDPPASTRGGAKRDLEDEVEDWSFPSLDGTRKEGDELMKKFESWDWISIDFSAGEATKKALLRIHSPYILHLATHGFFAKESPIATEVEPQMLLKDEQSVTKSKFFKNPMHRSGLALAGAETTIEAWKRNEVPPVENDGIVTAEDVGTLDLQGTWLVTLSACDTGSGEARTGEGVMGWRRGFIQAGAENLLMTLWPISDEVTVQIMSDFYDAAHKSGIAPQALAEVQRDWLLKLRMEKGLAEAVNLAGSFIMSSQGKP